MRKEPFVLLCVKCNKSPAVKGAFGPTRLFCEPCCELEKRNVVASLRATVWGPEENTDEQR